MPSPLAPSPLDLGGVPRIIQPPGLKPTVGAGAEAAPKFIQPPGSLDLGGAPSFVPTPSLAPFVPTPSLAPVARQPEPVAPGVAPLVGGGPSLSGFKPTVAPSSPAPSAAPFGYNAPISSQASQAAGVLPGGLGGPEQPKGSLLDRALSGLKRAGSSVLGLFGGGQAGGINPALVGAGLGLAAFPSFAGPQTPQVPNFRNIPSIQQLTATTGEPKTEAGRLATQRLVGRLQTGFQGVRPEITSQINRVFSDERANLTSQFKVFRPNADIATDSGLRRSVFDLEQRRAYALAKVEQDEFNRFREEQRYDISTALEVDQATLQQLVTLAQLDVDQISMQLGLDAQDAANFKQTFGSLGELFLSGGLGLASFRPAA